MTIISSKIKDALRDRELGAAVLRSCEHSIASRDRMIKDLSNWDVYRKRIREVRQDSLDNNEELLRKFEIAFTKSGGIIHYANDAESARSIVLNILRSRNCKRGVKSKSMVTEEIDLGKHLNLSGIDAVESDLGEFIVQLLHQPPSHITAPAIHLSRQSIGKLFADELNIPYTDDAVELTNIARLHLRERFLTAEFGISGANFLSARNEKGNFPRQVIRF